MKVSEFLIFTGANSYLVLKDAKNGREYTKINKYLDKEVMGCYARIDASGSFARAKIVAWIAHEEGRKEGRKEVTYET